MAEVEIAVEIRHETDLAYLIFDGQQEVWIPKSQVSDYCEDKGKIISIFIPEWLAEDKGLI